MNTTQLLIFCAVIIGAAGFIGYLIGRIVQIRHSLRMMREVQCEIRAASRSLA